MPEHTRGSSAAACARAALALAVAIAAVVPQGCERAATDAPQATRSATPLDARTTATISGTVRFEGTVPSPRHVDVGSDPTCAASFPGGLEIAEIRVTGGGLADAFVYIDEGLGDRVFAVPAEPVIIDQRGCQFVPDVAGVQVGQPLEFRNSDPTPHNVHGATTRSRPWNFGLAFAGTARRVAITAPEIMVPVRCNVHSWMRLDVGVVAHPYFAVTQASGEFSFSHVPAGTYVVAAWHRLLGVRKAAVTVSPGGHATVAIRFEAAAAG